MKVTISVESKLPLPMLWICYEWPYNDFLKDPKTNDMDPKVYYKITKDPADIMTFAEVNKLTGYRREDFIDVYKPEFTVSTLNTIWNGRCSKIDSQTRVNIKMILNTKLLESDFKQFLMKSFQLSSQEFQSSL